MTGAFSGSVGVPLRELALVFLTAAVVTFFATGPVRAFATRFGAVAVPRSRDVHSVPTPRLGGVAMYAGILAAVGIASQMPALTRGFDYTDTRELPAVLLAGGVIMLVGAVDDRWGIDALTKFVGQVTAGCVLVLMGVSWYVLYVPVTGIGTVVLDPLQSGLLTVLIVAATANAMNFVDGLDGLLAGLGFIAAAAICVFSLGLLADQGGDTSYYPPALISAALAGACLGFLPHNFQPARIFMGDSGSMLIGLMLAAASTSASGRVAVNLYGPADLFALLSPLVLVIAVMFIPFLDMTLAVIRRRRAGRSPFSPDKMHLHHRLLALGHSHRRVVLIVYLWVALLAFSVALSTIVGPWRIAPVFVVGVVVATLVTVVPRIRRRRRTR